MPSPPSFRKYNPGRPADHYLDLTSNTLPMSDLDDYAETMIAPRISMVNGVSQVQVQGAPKYAVRVQVDPDKLHAQQIGINEVDQALQNWNVNIADRPAVRPDATYNIKAAGQLMNAEAVPADRRHLPQRRAGPARAGRQRDRQRRGRPQRLVVLQQAHGKPMRSARSAAGDAPARQQHHRGDRRGRGAAAGIRVAAAAVGAPRRRGDRSQNHPRGVPGHPVHHAHRRSCSWSA